MNNLLRSLTEVKSTFPDNDLKLLLTTVKEGRRQTYDSKLSDPFYDSLEGLLQDLKTITIDNRDAEAFLKPVSKSEVPDYYDVISNPMDFQTMLKKVKQKQYKSKREFKDDLELIWSNCYTYNATENHPLRQCVKRLKVKADRLLAHITDRKERTDPPIPGDLVNHIPRPKINGQVNGRSHSRSLSAHTPSPSFPTIPKSGTPTINVKPTSLFPMKTPRRDAAFPDTPAIMRTPKGMEMFSQLDWEISQQAGPSRLPPQSHEDTPPPLVERLQQLSPLVELDEELASEGIHTPDDSAMLIDDVVGDKRKLNGFTDHRPSKRARFSSQYATPITFEKDELSELWWGAVQSDALLVNGFPRIPYPSSASVSALIPSQTKHPTPSNPRPRPKRRKKGSEPGSPGMEPQPKSLLALMNNNIKTMKRVRHTHARFAALNLNLGVGGGEEDVEGGGGGAVGLGTGIGSGFGVGVAVGVQALDDDGIEAVDDKVDERPWSARIKGKGRRKAGGIEIGERNAANCLQWMGGKVLEHAGFQGSSQAALDVLTGVTTEYMLNVGRTIRFLCDKYSVVMTPEEIILHTLFESGTSKIQDLERYISDDVVRHGSRLADLEKKLVTAYRDATAVEVVEDEGLFDEEDEEDAGVLAIGDFADALGEDYLGLRELGIAAEFGMSSLSIPKKLLKRKKAQNQLLSATAKPSEPPLPYPPPPPFIPLASNKVEDQIGLLKPYYQSRFAALTALPHPPPPPPPPLLGSSLPGQPAGPASTTVSSQPSHRANSYPTIYPTPESETESRLPAPVLILPDDPPNPAQVKMGPLGQIVKGGPGGGPTKKKKAAPSAGVGGGGGGGLGTEIGVAPPAKKKKTGMVGVGTGNGRKKKLMDAETQGQVPVQGLGMGYPLSVLAAPVIPPPVAAS